ncbi:MAG: NlpC/P60 family protein [Ruminococcaceae bacterium]|nr:NlpC/P60 family protein [Oscillospiraceae bacterium]
MRFLHKIISVAVVGVIASSVLLGAVAFARDGVVTASVLNVRQNPSYDADIIGQLNKDTMVNAYDCEESAWYVINYGDRYAYVAKEYIKLSTVKDTSKEKIYFDGVIYGKTNVGTLNVRNGASFDSAIVDTVCKGTKYVIYGEENGFFIVKDSDDVERYVYNEYVDAISQEEYNTPSGAPQVVEEAMKYIGTPYVYGGSSPRGFDCSGFTSYVYRQLGVTLNRTAAGQASNGISVKKSELLPGDLVLFNTYGSGIGHVGIYVGDGNMVHAPYSGQRVRVETINSGYYASTYVGARRIF